jgi:hypothetical protein
MGHEAQTRDTVKCRSPAEPTLREGAQASASARHIAAYSSAMGSALSPAALRRPYLSAIRAKAVSNKRVLEIVTARKS